VQARGCPRDILFFGHGDKVAEMAQFHFSTNDTRKVLRLKEHDISGPQQGGFIVDLKFETMKPKI
jgi:hypothetical protein